MFNDELAVIVTALLLASVLLYIKSISLRPGSVSLYELKRQAESGDHRAEKRLRREMLFEDIMSLKYSIEIVLYVLIGLCFLYLLGWGGGIVATIVTLVVIGLLARLQPLARRTIKLYHHYEHHVHYWVDDLKPVLRFMPLGARKSETFQFSSKEEVIHLIKNDTKLFTDNEKKLLESAVCFETKTVAEVMTPEANIISVKSNEMLGPLALDRLHKTNHTSFPVIKKDIHHVVGILFLEDAIAQIKDSSTARAEVLMSHHPHYLQQNETLPQAMSAFLRSRAPLFIVIDENEHTVGIITITDITATLFGRQLQNGSDQYEDVRAVANRASSSRQTSTTSTPQ